MPAPYAPQTWVDNTTPVDAAHMSHIESGIASADDAHTYLGDYNAGTTYYDGDIVVAADGFAYLCVKDGVTGSAPVAFPGSNGGIPLPVVNGQWVKGVGGAAVWSAIAAADLPPQAVPGYGTSLPASPSDGQEYVLVDSVSNPSYQWRFRYNAGSSSAYKWEFVGGSPATADVATQETSTSTSYVDLATVQAITLPRAGEYMFHFGAECSNSNGGTALQAAIFKAGSQISERSQTTTPGNNYGTTVSNSSRSTAAILAGDVLKLQFAVQFGGTAAWSNRNFHVFPVRVS